MHHNPTLYDYVDEADLEQAIEAGLISLRESGTGLDIYNYTDRAMYTPGAWESDAVRKCRGLIVNRSTGRIVARPWQKFFNHNQPEAGTLDLAAPVEVTDKLDGSLGILYLDVNGTPKVATRGSFHSDQAVWATTWLQEHPEVLPAPSLLQHTTLLVEIIYPDNRIVVDYKGRETLVLLGAVDISTGDLLGPNDVRPVEWSGERAQVFPYRTLREALGSPPRVGQEGLCVRYLNAPRIVKIKQADYVLLHRLIFGLSRKTVWEYLYLTEEPTFEGLVDGLPDEFLEWCENVWLEIKREVDNLELEASQRLAAIKKSLPADASRKDYSLEILKHKIYASLMFQLLDGKDIEKAALKYIRNNYQGSDKVIVRDESIA